MDIFKAYQQSTDGVVKTDANMPVKAGKTLIISKSDIPLYEKLHEQFPMYFTSNGILFLKIISDDEYAAWLRSNYEKKGGEYAHIYPDEFLTKRNTPELLYNPETGDITTYKELDKRMRDEHVPDKKIFIP